MSQYTVEYNILVNTNNAPQALMAFEQAVAPLTAAAKTLQSVANSVAAFNRATKNLTTKPLNIQVNIAAGTEAKLDRLLSKIRQIRQESRTMLAGGTVPMATGGATRAPRTVATPSTYAAPARRVSTGNIGYRVLGPTPIDVNGVAAIDFLKGMGIAYGVAGAGKMVSDIVKSATEYDNLIQTTKNILQTHDNRTDFARRFTQMESVIRNVGVETKFTAPEVADASKFLAMAGLNVDAIMQAIRPIADIALVGDTQLGETADVVTNIMTAYRMKPYQMRNAADVMTMTFTKSNTTLMEMAEAYKYSAALLSAGGISFEEASGALGVLGDAGIKGSQAGTTMRTIMANIVNPTKKQLKKWEEIGVERFGADGQVRPLRAIFEDLAKSDLYVSDFYQLFHKTAAQGAVSLANSVEKWNEIVTQNFLSDGLSKQLADKKKETIQGLWAQLTSAITEDGMKAFGGVQENIKSILKKGIGWLKSDEAVKLFHDGAKNFMEFGSMMVDSMQQIFSIFSKLGGLWKLYIKFQLWIYPLLTIVRAIKSIALAAKGLASLLSGLGRMIGGFRLSSLMARAFAGSSMMLAAGATGVPMFVPYSNTFAGRLSSATSTSRLNNISTFLSGGMIPLTKGGRMSAALAARQGMSTSLTKDQRTTLWNKVVKDYRSSAWNTARQSLSPQEFRQWQKGYMNPNEWALIRGQYQAEVQQQNAALRQQRKMAGKKAARNWGRKRAGGAAATGLAAAGTGYLIGKSTEWSSGGIFTAGLTTAAGVAAMGGPVGWIGGAVIAVGTLAAAWFQAGQEQKRALEALDQYNNSIQTYQGLWVGEGASAEARQMRAVYQQNVDLNVLIATRIDLMRELIGLSTGPVDTSGIKLSTDLADTLFDKFDAADSIWGSGDMSNKAIEMSRKYNENLYARYGTSDKQGWHTGLWSYDGDIYWTGLTGTDYKLNNPDRTSDQHDVATAIAIAEGLAIRGNEAQDILSRYSELKRKALWSGQNLSEIQDIATNWENTYGWDASLARAKADTRPDLWNYSAETFKAWTGEDWAQTYPYVMMLHNMFADRFGNNASFLTAANSYFTGLENNSLDEATVVNYIKEMDNNLGMWLVDYTKDNIDNWYRNMGIDPATGQFSGITVTDPITGQTRSYTGREAAQAVQAFAEQMLKLIPVLPPSAQQTMIDFQLRIQQLLAFARAGAYDAETMGAPNVGTHRDGEKMTVGGVTWTRTNGKWQAASGPFQLMDDTQFSQYQQALDSDKSTDNNSDGGGSGTTHTPRVPTGSTQDYKNHYKNQAAAPRQIIIKMDSLMNVESIDMTNADNSAVISNVKDQLAQALVDVVADFAASSQNLV